MKPDHCPNCGGSTLNKDGRLATWTTHGVAVENPGWQCIDCGAFLFYAPNGELWFSIRKGLNSIPPRNTWELEE